MTAKRFDYTAYDDGTESIYDRKKDKYYFDMQLSEIEEVMNELAEENEQLKNICKNLINQINKRGIKVTMTDNCWELLE